MHRGKCMPIAIWTDFVIVITMHKTILWRHLNPMTLS